MKTALLISASASVARPEQPPHATCSAASWGNRTRRRKFSLRRLAKLFDPQFGPYVDGVTSGLGSGAQIQAFPSRFLPPN